MKILIAITPLLVLLTGSAFADDWAHWRGPTGNGTSPNANPPTQWSETENVKWKVPIPGRGSGSPVVWGDKVFAVTAIPAGRESNAVKSTDTIQTLTAQRPQRPGGGRPGGGEQRTLDFVVLCFDRSDGNLVWQKTATRAKPHQGTHPTNGFASASPCTDGKHVYAHFGSRGLFCYTMDGKLKWSRTDFEPMITRNSFGEGSSPTIAGDKIIVPYDHEGQSYLYALNKLNGNTIWKTKRDEPTEWSTPLIVKSKSGEQVILNGQTCARSYDLETGKELWRCAGQTARPVACAVSHGDLVIVGSGFRGSFMAAFRLDGRGDVENTKSVVWTIDRDTPDIASPLLSDGRVYFHKGKTGILSCLDAVTGELHYSATRVPGINSTYASPIAAGGHVYLTGRSGTTVVIKDSDEFEVVSTNSVGEGVDATPAAAGDQLFIRGAEHLFCISSK